MKIDGLKQLGAIAKSIRAIPEASARAAYRAVNSVTSKVVTQSRRDIAAQINLPQSYIRNQTRVTKARPKQPIAYIRMRMRAVRMARFDARQLTTPAQRAKGDPRRVIGAGRKQAGVSVKIGRRGGRTSSPKGFLIPLRAGKVDGGNGFGIFVRTGKGKDDIKHKYGPSPDQLFRRWKSAVAPDIKAMLAEAYASQLRYELKGARK
ncbi:MAG: phage tail protein [Thauera sp.]|jgi:hypothetical protein|nr:phage tail protein [Thauera sp.]